MSIMHSAIFGEKPNKHIQTVKDYGGWVIFEAHFSATGPGHLRVIEVPLNSIVYLSIPQTNVRPSV